MATPKKKTKLKEPVKVRTKKLTDGSESYYLDIYVDGKRSYEYLKMYKLPEVNARVREQNRATLEAVETIKSQRTIEITKGKAGLKRTVVRSKMLLQDWLKAFLEEQLHRGVRGTKLLKTVTKLMARYDRKVRMGQIDKEWCKRLIDWLKNDYKSRLGKPLAAKSIADYISYLSTALNAAVRAEVIPDNPFMSMDPRDQIKVPESRREYLAIDEIKRLIATACPREDVKRAYLFACHCGLRLSDVYALRWQDITKDGEQWRASVVMRKTRAPLYMPLSKQAMRWLPDRPESDADDARIFATLPAEPNINKNLAKWVTSAGITKHITFHASRHTFGTLMLTLGADLYTTSKLLGHANVKTTTIYAKIIDRKKVDAVNLTDGVFD